MANERFFSKKSGLRPHASIRVALMGCNGFKSTKVILNLVHVNIFVCNGYVQSADGSYFSVGPVRMTPVVFISVKGCVEGIEIGL